MMARRLPLFDVLASRAAQPAAAAAGQAFSRDLLRDSVRRELELLFNSTTLAACEPLEQLAHAASSTLNYGVPDLAGKAASSLDHRWLAAQLAQAIRRFEPRLQAESVRVRARASRAVSHNVVSFEIDAALQHAHGAEAVELDSELDLESGAARVVDRPRARGPRQEAQR